MVDGNCARAEKLRVPPIVDRRPDVILDRIRSKKPAPQMVSYCVWSVDDAGSFLAELASGLTLEAAQTMAAVYAAVVFRCEMHAMKGGVR